MPPIDERGHDHDQGDDEDDDDAMPPLVDNPRSQLMTYTFYSEMTPASFSTSSSPAVTTFQHQPEPQLPQTPQTPQPPSEQPIASSSSTSVVVPPRGSHGKKRDASYIPRPPNAFILYRSSFIKSQQVTDKVEGNHSNLSKIIGKYWKTLPQAERDEWEAKAVLAQAEHRARYPDWRFRPGANALAKLRAGANADARTKGGGTTKTRASAREKGKGKETGKEKKTKKGKDNVGNAGADVDADTANTSGPSKRRRVTSSRKDPPRSRSRGGLGLDIEDEEDRGGGGDDDDDDTYEPPTEEPKRKRGRGASFAAGLAAAGTDTRKTAMDTRCAKIADLLGEGKTGVALEVAVKEWEGGRKRTQKPKKVGVEPTSVKDVGGGDTGGTGQERTEADSVGGTEAPSATPAMQAGGADTSSAGHRTKNPPHLHIPPHHTYAQPSPTSPLVHMISPTRSPASSYTQPASPYTQTTASPYSQTPASASPYAQTPPSPYLNSAPANPQHARSKSLYGRFPGHEAAQVDPSSAHPPVMQSSHSQPHPPTYTRAVRSSPGETHSGTRSADAGHHAADPQAQGPPRPLDLAAYTADALARGTPLTQLFKRSLSAPASENRLAYPAAQDAAAAGGDAPGDAGDAGRGRHVGRAGDGPAEPTRGALNPAFSFGGGGFPPLPPSHLESRSAPAHPQHGHADSHLNAHSTSHLPAFPQTHVGRGITFGPPPHPRPDDTPYQRHDAQRRPQQGSPGTGANPPQNPPSLTWMDEEHRRRLEAAREHGYWWDGTEGDDDGTDADAEGDVDEAVGEEGLGYDDPSNDEFDVAYSQHYAGSGSYARDDVRSGWTGVAGRHGLIAALEDPYLRRKSRSRSTTPPSKSHPLPPSAPIPPGDLPLSDALMASDPYPHHHHPLQPSHTEHPLDSQTLSTNDYFAPYHHSNGTQLPKSSFSTLAGWDGGSVSQAEKWSSGLGWGSGAWGTAVRTTTGGGEAERGRELSRDGRKVMFSVAEEDESGYGYGYRMGELGMGAEMRGVDRGTGVLYDDEDDSGNDMVVGSPPGGR